MEAFSKTLRPDLLADEGLHLTSTQHMLQICGTQRHGVNPEDRQVRRKGGVKLGREFFSNLLCLGSSTGERKRLGGLSVS